MHYLLNKIIICSLFVSSFFALAAQANEEIWLDVRTTAEYQEAHVEGAAHIPYEEVGARIADLITDKNAVIHVYCRSGNRSGIALKVLHDMGYDNAHNDGGLTNLNHKATIVR